MQARITLQVMLALTTAIGAAAQENSASKPGLTEIRKDIETLSLDPHDLEKKPSLPIAAPGISGLRSSESRPTGGNPVNLSGNSTGNLNWLGEKLRKDDSFFRDRRGEGNAASFRREAEQTVSASATLLNGFVDQWLSPADRSLFGTEAKARKSEMEGGFAPALQNLGRDLVPVGQSNRGTKLSPAKASNPYLDALSANPFESGTVLAAPMPEGTDLKAPTFDNALPREKPASPKTAYPLSRSAATDSTQMLPPNTPWVDQQKYFPQLRRF